MPYRIETTHTDVHKNAQATSLGPSLQLDDEKQARAVAEGLRAEGLDVALFEREEPTGTWKRVLLGEIDADGREVRRDNLLDEFVVIVRDGEGEYELASDTIFLTRALAELYAHGAYPDRQPLIVRGRFSRLRAD